MAKGGRRGRSNEGCWKGSESQRFTNQIVDEIGRCVRGSFPQGPLWFLQEASGRGASAEADPADFFFEDEVRGFLRAARAPGIRCPRVFLFVLPAGKGASLQPSGRA